MAGLDDLEDFFLPTFFLCDMKIEEKDTVGRH